MREASNPNRQSNSSPVHALRPQRCYAPVLTQCCAAVGRFPYLSMSHDLTHAQVHFAELGSGSRVPLSPPVETINLDYNKHVLVPEGEVLPKKVCPETCRIQGLEQVSCCVVFLR